LCFRYLFFGDVREEGLVVGRIDAKDVPE
jgi:hypothetical protein